jgi:hypothetical protein
MSNRSLVEQMVQFSSFQSHELSALASAFLEFGRSTDAQKMSDNLVVLVSADRGPVSIIQLEE